MMRKNLINAKLASKIATASAVGVLLASQAVYAAIEPGATNKEAGLFEFSAVDANNDALLSWTEIHHPYDDYLSHAGWDQKKVFGKFDANNDDFLSKEEYLSFTNSLTNKTAAAGVKEKEGLLAADADDEGWFEFDDVDGNNDKSLGWNEINSKYDDQLSEAGWNQEQVFSKFDANNDKMLDEQEYLTFSSQLQSETGSVPETEGMMAADADDEGWFEFDDVDGNNDNALGWNEINSKYDDQLSEAGWNQEQVFSQFDRNKDQVIDESEYAILVTDLQDKAANTNQQNKTASTNQQNQTDPQAAVAPPVAVITVMTVEQKPQEINFIELEDKKVTNTQGQEIGEVEDVVVRSGGVNETGLVLGVGGFWDMFDTHVYVPLSQIRLEGDQLVMQTTLDGEAIQDAAEYEYDEAGYTSLVEGYEEYQAGL